MRITATTSSDGVFERDFTLGDITGVLWSPASGPPGAPLVLMGHGGGLHKKAPGLLRRARYYAATCGYTVAAIDAPGHGARRRTAEDEHARAALRRAREDGEPLGPIIAAYNTALAERAVPEWRATLDALQAETGAGTPVGYTGMTLATAIGLALAAADPRINAAVIGGALAYDALTAAARRVTIPVRYLLPWDDAELDRASGIALFDALSSPDKTLHTTPGGHHQVPWYETEESARFFQRHLDQPTTPRERQSAT